MTTLKPTQQLREIQEIAKRIDLMHSGHADEAYPHRLHNEQVYMLGHDVNSLVAKVLEMETVDRETP